MLDPDVKDQYSLHLVTHSFHIPQETLLNLAVKEAPAAIVTADLKRERLLVVTKAGLLQPLSFTPAAAMDLALSIIECVRSAAWYGDDPVSDFSSAQQQAEQLLAGRRQGGTANVPLQTDDVKLLDSFNRNPNGSWTCIRPVTVEGPMGKLTIQPSQTFAKGLSFGGVNFFDVLTQMALRSPKLQ